MVKPSDQTQKPTISIIGAGRVGQAFAIALSSCGYPISALVFRDRRKVEAFSEWETSLPPVTALLASDELRAYELPDSDLTFLTTPDDVIEETAQKLSKSWGGNRSGTVLHTSGALSSEALSPLRAQGFETGSIHPLVSISEPLAGAAALRGAFYCLEGTGEATSLAQRIVEDLAGTSFTIKPEDKALYHAAAVMAAPHLITLFDIALELLSACGLSAEQAQKVFMPLLESVANNLKTQTPGQSLTGTFARGDIDTVRKHLKALTDANVPQALEVYELLGLHALQLAEKNRLDPERAEAIRKLLKSKK